MVSSSSLKTGICMLDSVLEKHTQEVSQKRNECKAMRNSLQQEERSFIEVFSKVQKNGTAKIQHLKSDYEKSLCVLNDGVMKLRIKEDALQSQSKELRKLKTKKDNLQQLELQKAIGLRDFHADAAILERSSALKASSVSFRSQESVVSQSAAIDKFQPASQHNTLSTQVGKNEETYSKNKMNTDFMTPAVSTINAGEIQAVRSDTYSTGNNERNREHGGAHKHYQHWKGDESEGVRVRFSHKSVGELELTVEELYSGDLTIDLKGVAMSTDLESDIVKELRRAHFSVKSIVSGQ